MPALRTKGDQQLEAQREQAQQAAREQVEIDPVSVLYRIQRLILDNRIAEARELARKFKAGEL